MSISEALYSAEPITPPDADLPPLSDPEAEGIIRRLARIEDEQSALKANFDALLKELDSRRAHILAVEGERLKIWTLSHLRGRSRSHRTLQGVAGFRAQAARLQIVDEAAVIQWAADHCPDAIYAKVNVRQLPKPEHWAYVDEGTGAVGFLPTPAGLEIVPAEDRFYVKSGAKATGGDDV